MNNLWVEEEIHILKEKYPEVGMDVVETFKSINPCDLSEIKDPDLFFSLIIGYIDGDGSISKGRYPNISIVSHANWKKNFEEFKKILSELLNKNMHYFKIYDETRTKRSFGRCFKSECVYLRINRVDIINSMKIKAKKLNLPIMERKWNRINENYKSINEKAKDRLSTIEKLCNKGINYKAIAKEVNLGYKYTKKLILENVFQLHDMPRVPRPGEFQTHQRVAGE